MVSETLGWSWSLIWEVPDVPMITVCKSWTKHLKRVMVIYVDFTDKRKLIEVHVGAMFLKFHCCFPLCIWKIREGVVLRRHNVCTLLSVCVSSLWPLSPFLPHMRFYMLHLLVGSSIVGLMLTPRRYSGIVFIYISFSSLQIHFFLLFNQKPKPTYLSSYPLLYIKHHTIKQTK